MDKLHRRDFTPDAKGPLSGLRVVDMSRLVCGNMLSLQLADFGADVIKVEPAGKGDPLRSWGNAGVETQWKAYGRNKRSIALDLRGPQAAGIVKRLCSEAAVLVEGFRPGRLEQMGLAPGDLLAANPALVITRISGYGQTGPYSDRPGFGSVIEGLSGFAGRNGFPDREPVLPPIALADMVAGLQGAFATMVAVREAETSGRGQIIDLALLEPLYGALGAEALIYQVTGEPRLRHGSGSNTSSPRNVYRTKDGKWIAVSGSIQSMAERIFRVVGREDMITDPRYATNEMRVKNKEEVDAAVSGWIRARTLKEAMVVFEAEAIAASPIHEQADILNDRHVIEREVVVKVPDRDLGEAAMHNITPRLSMTPGHFRREAPRLGQDSRDILREHGVADDDIDALIARGVVGNPVEA